MPTCDKCFGSGWAGVIGPGDQDRAPCPKCNGTGILPGKRWKGPRPLPGKGALLLILIAGLGYLGYLFGIHTGGHIGSDRPLFFAMVGGYVAILLGSMRGTGIIGPIILAGLVEFVGQLYLDVSIHNHIFDSF